jgi:SAM-dependent methyltransferase
MTEEEDDRRGGWQRRSVTPTGAMAERSPAHTDRCRAGAFGSAAEEYDRHRPRYPAALIAGLVADDARVLDVGAGTGIASAQLVGAGAEVLAVEPDSRMARVAAGKGIHVEQATFEDWQPAGRSFDLVVFAQSFHWVQPRVALKLSVRRLVCLLLLLTVCVGVCRNRR